MEMDKQQLLAILATILLTGSDISTSMEDEEKRGSGYSVKGAVEMAAEILEKAETYALTLTAHRCGNRTVGKPKRKK